MKIIEILINNFFINFYPGNSSTTNNSDSLVDDFILDRESGERKPPTSTTRTSLQPKTTKLQHITDTKQNNRTATNKTNNVTKPRLQSNAPTTPISPKSSDQSHESIAKSPVSTTTQTLFNGAQSNKSSIIQLHQHVAEREKQGKNTTIFKNNKNTTLHSSFPSVANITKYNLTNRHYNVNRNDTSNILSNKRQKIGR